MELRIQVVAIVASGALLLVILELVRRRRLLERYAILWLFSAMVLLGLAGRDVMISRYCASFAPFVIVAIAVVATQVRCAMPIGRT